ncbi:Tetratricopeptide repeat protein 39B, partial [Coelomomyces lativittatus]
MSELDPASSNRTHSPQTSTDEFPSPSLEEIEASETESSLQDVVLPSEKEILNLLNTSIEEIEEADGLVSKAVDLFLNNDFTGSLSLLKPQQDFDSFSSLGVGLLESLEAFATFDLEDLKKASKSLKKAETLAEMQYKLATPSNDDFLISKWIKGSASFIAQTTGLRRPPLMNHAQIRSAIIKAESSLINGILFMLQENVIGYVKAGLALRRSHKNMEHAWHTYHSLIKQSHDISKKIDRHTLSGIFFGIGGLNVAISMLPSKILKVVSILGFKGDRAEGFRLLEASIVLNSARSPLASLFLGGYHSVISSFSPILLGPSMIPCAARTLGSELKKFPRSPFHLMLIGRTLRTVKDVEGSSHAYQLAMDVQSEWEEIKHLCRYELAMNAMMQLNWSFAASCFHLLKQSSYWSKAFFAFAEATCLDMMGQHNEAKTIFKEAPELIGRKFGGKNISVEVYIANKVKIYEGRDFRTYLPGLEILLIWNAFVCMSPENLDTCHQLVLEGLGQVHNNNDNVDAEGVLHLVLAAIEIEKRNFDACSRSLDWIRENEKEFVTETWVFPFSLFYRALYHILLAPTLQVSVPLALEELKKSSKYSEFCFEY